jgi:putative Mn2+ efflux pump MntP
MDFIELIIVAIGLAMDATAVSIGKGLGVSRVRVRHALSVGIWFGGFQALMPIIGYLLGLSFTGIVSSIDHWIAFALLAVIGVNMIRETLQGGEENFDNNFGIRSMIVLAIATSIDALVVGVSFAMLGTNIWTAALVIGVVTCILSILGIYGGRYLGKRIGSKAGIVGGLVLIGIGTKILIEHTLL